jgi:hypothetical protein
MTTKKDSGIEVLFPLLLNKLSELKEGRKCTLRFTIEDKLLLFVETEQVMNFDLNIVQGIQEFTSFIEEVLNQ